MGLDMFREHRGSWQRWAQRSYHGGAASLPVGRRYAPRMLCKKPSVGSEQRGRGRQRLRFSGQTHFAACEALCWVACVDMRTNWTCIQRVAYWECCCTVKSCLQVKNCVKGVIYVQHACVKVFLLSATLLQPSSTSIATQSYYRYELQDGGGSADKLCPQTNISLIHGIFWLYVCMLHGWCMFALSFAVFLMLYRLLQLSCYLNFRLI